MDLVKANGTELQIQTEFMQSYHNYLQQKKHLAEAEKKFKKELIKAMEETGVKSFENDLFKFTYIAPQTRCKTEINETLLKQDGLYDRYASETETPVKASVRITTK